jgi:hypothetical protein
MVASRVEASADTPTGKRCSRCGWPLTSALGHGCVLDNCSCRCEKYPHCACGRADGKSPPIPPDPRDETVTRLLAEIEQLLRIVKQPWSDKTIPEVDAINAAHPLNSKDPKADERFLEALRMVGANHSKYALVNLVNWLLSRAGDDGWQTSVPPQTHINVRDLRPTSYRWLAYKGGSQQFQKGIKGRWRRATDYGWENAELPEGCQWKLNPATNEGAD